jgi:hypothetical protein
MKVITPKMEAKTAEAMDKHLKQNQPAAWNAAVFF